MAKIIYTQVSPVEREKWTKVEANQVKTNQPIEPIRGNILDANGNLLAGSLPQYNIYMDTRVEALHQNKDSLFNRYIDSIATGLSLIIGDKTPQQYRKFISDAFHTKTTNKKGDIVKGKNIRLCKGRITYAQKRAIEQLPLVKRGAYKSGITFEEHHQREKPFGRLGSHTIGSLVGSSGCGNAGLEKTFDNELRGIPGVSTLVRVGGHWENITVQEPVNGCDVVTTLDANLMDICESALQERLDTTRSDWGCVILMETHSGKIKAISNLRRDKNGNYHDDSDYAVTRVEPGSTFKTITLTAVLDDDKIGFYDTVRVTSRPWEYIPGSKHIDAHPRDTVYTVRSALAISSNIAFAKIVIRSYNNDVTQFLAKLDQIGVSHDFYTALPNSTPPKFKDPHDKVTLGKMSYGYSVEMSPMQILAFYNAIANDGKMIRPYLVSRIEQNGETVKTFDTEVLNPAICKPSTLNELRLALHDVVWDDDLPGTASVLKWGGRIIRRKAQSDLVHIAGKTGTAQLFYNGRYHGIEHQHRLTFVGYFPEEDPQYTCICMMEYPKNYPAYDAGWDCGTVVRQIAEKTMAYGWVYEMKNGQTTFKKR